MMAGGLKMIAQKHQENQPEDNPPNSTWKDFTISRFNGSVFST